MLAGSVGGRVGGRTGNYLVFAAGVGRRVEICSTFQRSEFTEMMTMAGIGKIFMK